MLSIPEPPGLSNSSLLLTRRSTNHKDGYIKPLIVLDHRLDPPYPQSPGVYIENGSKVQVKVFFNIEVLRLGIDGLPRTDILLSFDELIAMPYTKTDIEMQVSSSSWHLVII